MPEYKVMVERRLTLRKEYTVDAPNEDEAREGVEAEAVGEKDANMTWVDETTEAIDVTLVK